LDETGMPSNRDQALGYALAVLAACLWSTLGVLGKIAYSLGAEPLVVVSLRASIAATILGVGLVLMRRNLLRVRRRDLPFFAVYGVLGIGLNYLGYFFAIKFTSVSTAIVLLYTYPAVVVVFAFVLYRERITAAKLCGLLLTFVGILFVAWGTAHVGLGSNPIGLGFALLAGLGNASYALGGKRALATYNTETALFYSLLFGSLMLDAFAYFALGPSPAMNAGIFAIVLTMAIVPTVLGYGAFTYSLRFVEAGEASIVSSVEPAISMYMAYLFLGETLNLVQLIGSALILFAVVMLQLLSLPTRKRQYRVAEWIESSF